MIKNISLMRNEGTELVIPLRDPRKTGFYIINIDGLGSPKATINYKKSMGSVVGAPASSTMNNRGIELTIGVSGVDNDVEKYRRLLYAYCPPDRKAFIGIETDTRKMMIPVWVEENQANIFREISHNVINLLAIAPFFSDREETIVPFAGQSLSFEFPFSNESLSSPLIELGSSFSLQESTFFYDGDVTTGVKIQLEFLNQVTSGFSISNNVGGDTQTLNITKSFYTNSFDVGDILTINTVPGNKYISVYDKSAGTTEEHIELFQLTTDWLKLERGYNTIRVDDTIFQNCSVVVTYTNLYAGV